MKYSIHDEHGQIRLQVGCPRAGDVANYLHPGWGAVVGTWDPDRFYIQAGQAVARASIDCTVEGSTIRGLPIPCLVEIEGRRYDVDDGDIELEFTHPGPYRVTISANRHLTTVVTMITEGRP